jgi:gliding motility-associated-like protein
VYGAANPSLTFQYSGWLNGDDAADLAILPVASTTVNLVSPVSVYDDAINVAGGTDGNYDFLYVAADFSVTKAILTVTADEKTKVYADTNPTLTFTYTGFVNGDDNSDIDINPTIITIADEYSETGLYPIVLGGGSDNNYSLSRTDGALTVVKATLQATADDKEKTYSEANPILTVTYSGFKNSDNSSSLDISPVASVAATTLSDAGTYPVTLSAGSDNNYDIVNTKGVLTIKKAALTIISDNKARLYGEANPALTVSYSGFVNSENEDVLDTKPLAVTVAVPTDATGVYAITASGAADNNYSFSYIDGSFVISKAMLTITAEGKSRKYGETNPAFTYIYSGFKNDDDARDIDLLPTQTTDAVSTTPVGSMQISLTGGTDNNYDFTLVNGILAITKNNLIISTDNKSKVYGQSNPPLTIRYSGFVNGEDHSVLLQAPQAEVNTDESSDAGTYAISVSGAASPNYEIEYLEGSIEVTKAPLHITADDAYKKFLEAIPELTISYSGFVNNENKNVLNVLPSVSTNAGSGSDAGVYDITASGASDNNYNFIYNKGILSILKADQVITFEDIPEGMRTTQEYRLEASSTSGLPVIFESSEPATVTLSGSDMEVIREGSVQISASQNGNHNWNAAPDVIRTVQTLPTFDNLRSLFTPNNDGMNDTWYIPDIEQYGKFSIQIFNRFGKLLYESSAYKNDWNGTYNGSPLPSASYYYLIKSSEKGIIKGVVNILR